ncbi:hypothetical protein WJ972_24195 [Achromobacter insuavis]
MSVHHDTPAPPPIAHASVANRRASQLAGVALVLFMAGAMLSNIWWSVDHDVLPDDTRCRGCSMVASRTTCRCGWPT